MKPYFQEGCVTIYCGDAREILGEIEAEAIITDPVWPNASKLLQGATAPRQLLAETLACAGVSAQRVVVHLGCASDPRFLTAVPERFPFIRTCWLELSVPSYAGRVLVGSDVAFVFGAAPPSRPGARVLPGRCISTTADGLRGNGRNKDRRLSAEGVQLRGDSLAAMLPHPCPRKLTHVRWLVKWFGGAAVVDPFMGSGTTAVACKAMGVQFVGIEIEERYCEMAVERLRQRTLEFGEVPA